MRKAKYNFGAGWHSLAEAVVIKAAQDYRIAQGKLRQNPYDITYMRLFRETKRFFRSEWCDTLADMDGDVLLERLEKEGTKQTWANRLCE